MPPLIGFAIGVVCSELMQWGLWITAHPGRARTGYWYDGVPHFLAAWSTCGVMAILWHMRALDLVTSMLPELITAQWADTGIPYTPQVGLMLGLGLDFMADKVAFALRVRFGGADAPPVPPSEVKP